MKLSQGHRSSRSSPLEGLVVVCFAELYPGPYATALLVDLGAEVILVERPTGERAREIPDFFCAFARGKRSVSLDLKRPEALHKIRPLIERADVVYEGFSPGTADRLGIGYDALISINPKLIYISISGFGQTGPYRDRVAHDLSYQGVTGVLADQIDSPQSTMPAIASGDVSAALFSVIGMLSALHGRATNGKGSFVDVSVTDCLVSCMAPWLTTVLNQRPPLSVAEAPANGVFHASDGRALSLSIMQEDNFWRELCDLLDLQSYAELDFGGRHFAARTLKPLIAERIAAQPFVHWAYELDRRRIAWSPMLTPEEVTQDPHFQARSMFDEIHTGEGTLRFVRQPLKFSEYTNAPVCNVPTVGDSNDELLARHD